GVTLLVCLGGLVGNGTILWLLIHIHNIPINSYFKNLALTNLIFSLFMAISSLLYMIENASCSAILPTLYLSFLSYLSLLSCNTGLYFLTAISIEMCVSISFLFWSPCCRRKHFSAMVSVLLGIASIAVFAVVISLCSFHEPKHCRMALISMYVLNFLIFVLPMVISNIKLFIEFRRCSQQHRLRRLYIVIFITVLFFLTFALPLSIWNFQQQFSYTEVPLKVVFLLACINSSINPFICFLVGSSWRRCSVVSLQVAFRRVFDQPEDNTARSNDIAMDTVASAC
ncbi:PREDICTED: proto-oncogene Mas-like, partial [Cariama cristata]|uniref:proto-oncogene Mas-like n=1 Tax=Cariama cristata TaxID=54380 RepID=UPI00052056BD